MSDEAEVRAAELAFGLVDGPERRSAEARVEADPAFSAALRRWQDRANALLSGADEAPRPSLWAAILAQLPANDAAAVVSPPAPRDRLRWWQAATALATAAAIVLGVIASERPPLPAAPPASRPDVPAPPLVAVLTGSGDAAKAVLTVSYDRVSGRLTTAPVGLRIGDHAAELWVIPNGGAPRSLGAIADKAPGWTAAPAQAAPALVPGATLAVSVEPIGGSPTGQPTGPVILTGTIGAA